MTEPHMTEPHMTERPWMKVNGIVLDAPDPRALAGFYSRMLGWPVRTDEPEWVTLQPPNDGAGLSFQKEDAYVRPVWPAGSGDQQMQVHLDIEVRDLDAAVAHAVEAGATVADFQPQADVRVMLDPVGHPFCLWTA